MTFVVEDGTGKVDANAYIDVALADSYDLDHGTQASWTALSSPLKEQAIRLATQYLDAAYLQRWGGTRLRDVQHLAWPRVDVYDNDEFLVRADEVPWQVEEATAEMARRSAAGDVLMPDVASASNVISESKSVGPLSKSVTYSGVKEVFKRYSIVENLLSALLVGGGSIIMERA